MPSRSTPIIGNATGLVTRPEGGTIIFTLSGQAVDPVNYEVIHAKESFSADISESGYFTANVWPNKLSQVGYNVEIKSASGSSLASWSGVFIAELDVALDIGQALAQSASAVAGLRISNRSFRLNASTEVGARLAYIDYDDADAALTVLGDSSEYFSTDGHYLTFASLPAYSQTHSLMIGAETGADTMVTRSFSVTSTIGPVSGDQVHVFVLWGQSNGTPRAEFDGGTDYPTDGRVLEVGRSGGSYTDNEDGAIINAVRPLDAPSQPTAGGFGFALQFALDYLDAHPGVTVLFVPCNRSGTGFLTGADYEWGVGKNLSEDVISRTNAVFADNPDFVLKGFLGSQGEANVANKTTSEVYQPAILNQFAEWRSRITAASDATPFIHMMLAPEYKQNNATAIADKAEVEDVLIQLPALVDHCGVAHTLYLETVEEDNTHFNAEAHRSLGSRMFYAWQWASGEAEDSTGSAGVPGAPGGGSWTDPVDAGGGEATFQLSAIVSNKGAPIIRYDYKVGSGGTEAALPSIEIDTDFTVTAAVGEAIYLRAVNAMGEGPWNAGKAVASA